MKTFLPILLAALFGLSACSTVDNSRQKRIERNPEIYQALPEKDRVLVDEGRVREGMSKEAVFLAMGRPDDVSRGSKRGVNYEAWTYTSYAPTTHSQMGFGMGYGYGGWGYPYRRRYDPFWYPYSTMGMSTVYQSVPVAKIEFLNDKVIGWESRGRRRQ